MPIDFNIKKNREEEKMRLSEQDLTDQTPVQAMPEEAQEASPALPEVQDQGMEQPLTYGEAQQKVQDVYQNHQALDDARESAQQYAESRESGDIYGMIQGQGRLAKDAETLLRDDYSLTLEPGVWDAISGHIAETAESEGKEAAENLSYKYACAIELANRMDMSVTDSMDLLDNMMKSQYPDAEEGNYKSNFKAIQDSWTMGKNTVALADLGNRLQTFEMLGDEENAQKCRDKIKAYNEYNETLQDSQPRSWMIEALKSGAQTLPYSAAVGVPSLLAGVLAPGLGTAMGFAAGFDATYGLEYIDLRDAGVDPKTASSVAALSSAGQAAVEQSLGTIANTAGNFGASVGRRALSNTILEKGMDEVASSISKSMFQHFHFGEQGFKAIARGLMEYGENALEEGAEEAIQEYISAGGKYLAAWASDNDIDLPDAQEIWASAVEEAKGAFMGSLILGIPDAAFSAKATARDFVDVRNQALSAQSKEAFIKEMQSSGSQVFEGMSGDQIKESASNIFDKFTTDREKQADALTRENAENYSSEEGMEVLEQDEQGNETEAPAEYRRDGKLYTQDDLTSIDEDGNTHGTFRAGDEKSGKNYGYVKYTVNNESGTVTIDNFRMTESRDYLRKELFEDFADNFADYRIEWNPTGKQAQNIKANLIKANPRGEAEGLSYYTTGESQQVTRARVEAARQVRQNFKGFTDREVYHAVSFFEAMAQADGKNIQEFMDQRFGGQIFGDSSVLDQAARMQNAVDENGNSIAKGGIDIQGVKDSIRATIYAGEKADFSTWIHELTHLWRKMQDSESLRTLEDALGVKDGVWTDDQDEKLAELSEAAFTGGQVKNESLKGLLGGISGILQKIKDYIQRIASIMMRRGGLNDTITSELSKMIKGDDSLMMKAAQADREAQEQDRKQQEEKEAAAAPEENIRKAEQTASQDETLRETKERLIRSDAGTETAEQVQQTQQVMESDVASLSEKSESTMDESGSLRAMAEAQKDIPDMLFQLVGKSVISQSPELSKSFLTFVQMKKQGYPAEDIKQATGWEQDAQGNVWHEEDNLTFRNEAIEKDIEGLLKDNDKYRNAIITLKPLSEIVKDNEALLYPGLKDATVYLINMPVNRLDAMYMGDSNAIVINTAQVKEGWGFTRALTNGIQQAVLRSEGLMDMNTDVLEKLIAQNSIYISELKKQGVQLTEEQKKSVSDLFTEYYTSAVGKIAQRAEERYARNEKPSTLFFTPAAPKLQFQLIGSQGAANLDEAENAVTRRENLDKAREMEKAGKDAKTIRLATGWEKGADNNWKYEIDDSSFRFDVTASRMNENPEYAEWARLAEDLDATETERFRELDAKYGEEGNEDYVKSNADFNENRNSKTYKLKDILYAPELFKSYPELKPLDVKFRNRDDNTRGHYENYGDFGQEIVINERNLDINDNEKITSTLLHEVQHAIQNIEGFENGGSENSFKTQATDEELAKQIDEMSDRELELKKQIEDEVGQKEFVKQSTQRMENDPSYGIEKHFNALEANLKKSKLYPQYETLQEELGYLMELQSHEGKVNLFNEEQKYFLFRMEDLRDQMSAGLKSRLIDLYNLLDTDIGKYDAEYNGLSENDRKLFDEWSGLNYNLSHLREDGDWVKPYEAYFRIKGEVEARNVQARHGMTASQRLNTLLSETEDRKREQQISSPHSRSLFQKELEAVNTDEDKKEYQKQLSDWFNGSIEKKALKVSNPSIVYRAAGLPDLPFYLTHQTFEKITAEEGHLLHGGNTHGLDFEVLKDMPDYIKDPLMIFKSETVPGLFNLLVDGFDQNDRPLLVSVSPNIRLGHTDVNRIASIYGRNNKQYFVDQIKKGNLLYIDEERSRKWANDHRVQYLGQALTSGSSSNVITKESIVNNYKDDKSGLQFQTVFHGTSADFDRFSNDHINEGEGSQSFGYGLYFTQAQDIARDYADRQAMDKLNVEDSASLQDFAARRTAYLMLQNRQLEAEEAKLMAWNDQSKAFDRQKQSLVNDASLTDEQKDEKYRQIEKNAAALGKAFQNLTFDDIKKQAARNLYTVEIPDSGYIDWEGDVSAKDAQKVKKGLREALLNDPDSGYDQASAKYLDEDLDGAFQELTGQQLYGNLTAYLGSDKKASELLNGLGFKGIKYPAGTNFGYKGTASNFVIFSDEDIAITEHIQFQTEDELMKDAASFDSWKEFMDYYQTFGSDAVPSDADATWYENTWSRARQIESTEETLNNEREEHAEADTAEDMEGDDPIARDALFITALKSRPNMLEDFLSKIEEIRDEDYIEEPQDQEEADYNEHLRKQKDYISKFVKHATVKSYAKGIASGKTLDLAARTKIANTMGNSARAYRALYADVMQDSSWQVRKEDTVEAQIKGAQEELKKLTGIESDANIDTMSAEERTKIAKKLQNEVLREKVRNGTVLAGADYDSLIKQMEGDIKAKQDEIDENQRKYQETLNDIADYEQRDLLKKYEELLVAKAKYGKTGTTASKHAESAVQTGERYRSGAYQDETGTYSGIYRRYKDAEKLIKATEEVKYAQKLLEKTQELREDVRDRKAEQSEVRKLKDLRKRLVKRTMRRVDFKNIDYTHARTLIAIQRLFEPNLEGGVNRWIGSEGRWARDIWSQYYTDSDARKKILKELDRVGNSAAMDLMQLLENTKSEDDFARWTNKQRQAVYKLLPKEDWVKELRLLELDKEREESIQLPMEERTYTRKVKGDDGNMVTETIWRLEPSEELAKEIRDCVGVDLYNDLTYKDFAEWTTADMEKLARKVDDYYVEGKNELAARKKARKDMAAAYRERIQKAIKNTGIVINADDSPEEKARKQKKIDRILGFTDGLKGTAQDSTKRQSIFSRVLHGYFDANVRRVARILDNQGEGINTDLLYWGENEAYNAEERAKERRVNKVNDAMQKAGVSVEDLYKKVEIDDFYGDGRSITLSVDELLYYYQAQFDEMSRDAVAYGSMMDVKDREAYQAQDRDYLDLLTKLDEEAIGERAAGNDDEANRALEEREKMLPIEDLQAQTKAMRAAHPGWSDERIHREVHLKNPGTEAYKAECNRRYALVLDEANRIMNENKGLRAFADAIADDYATEFDRIQQTSIDVFNSPVARVENYVPLVRLSLGGDTNENRVKADLLAQTADASSQQGVDKGMTQKRIRIAPLNQRPVEAGLYKTWADQVERTEHFIAYADYVRTLRDVYGSRDSTATMQWMESRYGKGMKDYVKDYISEVANPEAGQQRSSIDSFVRAMRGKTAPAYLSWKMSSVIKQAITSPMPYMQFMSPVEYLGQVFRMIAHPKQMEDAIKSKSMFMKSRKFDPIADVISEEMNKQNNSKIVTLWNQFSNLGMQGLEWIDWACVAPGWNAIYEREYKALSTAAEEKYQQQLRALKESTPLWESMSDEEMNREAMEGVMTPEEIERRAVDKADDCVRLAQPSNRTADISPLFKTKGTGNEIVKALLQFTMSLNVIWQNIRYDLPYAVRNSQYRQAVGMIAGYTLAGIGLSMLDGNVPAGDDDAEEQAQKMRNLIYGATTQFTDAMPIIGSAVSTMDEKLITGQSSFSSGTDLFPTLTKFINGTTSLANGDWDKAAAKYGEGVAMFIGAPVSGTKEMMHLFGLDDDEEGVQLHPEAVLGQRD